MVAANLLIGIAPKRPSFDKIEYCVVRRPTSARCSVVELADVARGLTQRQAIAWRRIDASGRLRMFLHGSHS